MRNANTTSRLYRVTAAGAALLMLASPLALADVSGTILPSADGTYTQWTPLTGTTHYTTVDESACNGTTDYNFTNTVGNRDSYAASLASVPDASTITEIAITPCASRNKGGGGSATMNVFYRFNGANSADGGSYALTGTTPVGLAATSFGGLAFSKSASSTLQIGAVLSAGTKGARLSRIATVITYTPLAAPSGLLASATTTSAIRLTWNDNATNETAFEVERSPDGSAWAHRATTSANTTAYDDTGLSPETTYYYRLRAYNSGGYSSYSNTAQATTLPNPPAAPSGLTAIATTTSSILIAWTDNSANETNFAIERSPDGSAWAHIASTSANQTYYNNTGLASDTMYYYHVRASNAGGYSGYSNTASAATLPDTPAAPSSLIASATTTTTIYLTWSDNATNETAFEVERSPDGSAWAHYATTSANSTSYNDAGGYAPETTYYYRLRAYNADGYSSYSNTASATTLPIPPYSPSNLSGTATSTDVFLTWTDNSANETAFDVHRGTDGINFSHIATTSPNVTSYNDPGLASGVYYHRVRAYNLGGYSGFSNAATTTVP